MSIVRLTNPRRISASGISAASGLYGVLDAASRVGLEAWWDASDSASVTLDSGRVSQLNDKSGNGRHASNTTSGSTQPSYITDATNGRNVVRFAAASSQRLTVASSTDAFNFIHTGSPSFIIAVASFGASSNPATGQYLMGNSAAASANRGFFFGYEDESPFNNASTFAVHRAAQGSPAVSVISNDKITPQTTVVLEVLVDADNATANSRALFRVNGDTQYGGNTNTFAPAGGDASFNLQLGATGNNANPMTGDLCEVLIYSRQPSSATQTAIRRYLGAKWGITIP